MSIRLADFIRDEVETILRDWEAFAKTIAHAGNMGTTELRDHARQMLLAIADDLDSDQSDAEQAAKSKGHGTTSAEESSAQVHGADRHGSGFSVMETVSEFRALRASVVSRWTKAQPNIAGPLLEDLTRFHEAIDQAVAESLEHYVSAKKSETRLFGAVLLASPDPINVLDPGGRFVYANKATADLFALEPRQIIGKSVFELGFPFASDFHRNLEKVVSEQSIFRGKLVHTFGSAQGEQFEYLLAPVVDEDSNTEAAVCIFRDVTIQALAEEKIWRHAHHDLLTGLPNRRLFMDRLEQEIKHAKRTTLPLAVLFMDLDGFKDVNDSLGHEAGDRLLADVAQRLTACVREDDTIARLGGDEFSAILVGARQSSDAERVAQAIIEALAMPFFAGTQPIRVSVSIGIALYPEDADSPDALLQAADKAMYRAKKTGSNRICVFGKADTKQPPSA